MGEKDENIEIQTNKHIGIACGQTLVLGALKVLREEYWHINIEEIFATSSGTLLGMIVLLNIDFDD